MIQPIPDGVGVPRVRCLCDGCGREEVVTCDYERTSRGDWAPNEGQAHRKMQGRGWALSKGKLRCPKCEGARKQAMKSQAEERQMQKADVTHLRQPTREQKRQIMGLLEVSYDTGVGRYKGADTDKTIAETIGGGCMPGWVSELREDFFGPDGANDDLEKAIESVVEALTTATKAETEAAAIVKTIAPVIADLKAMKATLENIRSAFGPKAARA